ncbi:MAG: UDP-N-acetylglucosamine 4,6-dehydratase (inverting) [bacterium]|nr:UDP-N-acetylglucosamine 4,6-dehydratase (inverting) [bacterium]
MFTGKTVLITGGTGSFGKNFTKYILETQNPKKVAVFSRDEFKQYEMAKEIKDKRLRFLLGDVRDLPRLQRAFNGVDIVIHAAALKQVPALEYNPFEAVKTNILGSQNVVDAALDQKVSKVLLVSTDKAVQPINLYGATKLAAEKLFIAANAYSTKQTVLSAVRYGNVIASRGSIIEHLIKNGGAEKVQITHPEMTRFWLTLEESFNLVMFAMKNMEGGEIFIPQIPTLKIGDLFDVLAPKAKKEIIGLRPGEKMHEILLTQDEARHGFALDNYFVILPQLILRENMYQKYLKKGKKLSPKFQFTSDIKNIRLTKNKFKEKIKAHLI